MSVELIIYLVFSASIASILIILVELLTVLAERGKKKGIEWEQFLHSAHSKLILPIDCITAAPHVKKNNPVNKVYGRLKKKLNKLFEKKIQRSGVERYELHAGNLPANCSPLLCFVNCKSGGNQGKEVLDLLKNFLNPKQVYDLSEVDPVKTIESFLVFPSLRVLVAGGDGTACWIVKAIETFEEHLRPPIVVLPLGTGNDLARYLGWGGTTDTDAIPSILESIQRSSVTSVDRWEVSIDGRDSKGVKTQRKVYFNNYFGIGVDAQIALNFHTARQASPQWFISQLGNKFWYGIIGGCEILDRRCAGLAQRVHLIIDDADMKLPSDAEGIIFSNIPSYGGGAHLWTAESESRVEEQHEVREEQQEEEAEEQQRDADIWKDSFRSSLTANRNSRSSSSFLFGISDVPERPTMEKRGITRDSGRGAIATGVAGEGQKESKTSSKSVTTKPKRFPESAQDGRLEVVSVDGSLQLAQIQLGLNDSCKLGQGSAIRIRVDGDTPMQIDGEPWVQIGPCEVTVTHIGQARMLLRPAAGDSLAGLASDVIEWAHRTNVISASQRIAILQEFSRRVEQLPRDTLARHRLDSAEGIHPALRGQYS